MSLKGSEELRGLVGFKHLLSDIVTPVGQAEKLDGAYLLALMALTTTVTLQNRPAGMDQLCYKSAGCT